MVEQSSELLLLSFPCCLPHTVQPLGHARPALCRVHVRRNDVLPRLCPSLPCLRRRSPSLVRLVHITRPDHGNSNRPKDGQDHRIHREAYLRKKDQPQYRDLKDNQPNTTTNQQARQLAFRVMPAGYPEIRAEAGCEHENRRAKMRDPASKKDSRSRARQVSRQELLRTSGHVVANVIDRHQHHDGATQSIHRLNARRRYRLGGNRGSSHDFAILFFTPASGCRFFEEPPPVGVRIQRHLTRRVHSGGGVLAPEPASPAESSANGKLSRNGLVGGERDGQPASRTAESK